MQDEYELDVPIFVELKDSLYVDNELGVFCLIQLNADRFLGNYKGKIRKSLTQCLDTSYVWTIFNSKQIPLFYVDASDPKDSNWLRFIRYTSDASKSNVICMQQNQQINYYTLKSIAPGEELLTYMPSKKRSQVGRPTKQPKSFTCFRLATAEEANKQLKKPLNIDDPESIMNETQASSSIDSDERPVVKKYNFKCDVCQYRSDVYEDIKAHIYSSHVNSNYNRDNEELHDDDQITLVLKSLVDVTEQNLGFDEYQKMIEHQLNSKENRPYRCNFCDECFLSTSSLIEHLPSHNEFMVDCEKNDYQSIIYTHLIFNTESESNTLLEGELDDENTLEEEDLEENDDEDELEEEGEGEETQTTQSENDTNNNNKYTCSHCKKQFEDRVELVRHQRTESSIKMAKKKKELRKKKWRDAHWKKKIDLSFIETLTLNNISTNITDNLSFCVDGTSEDLKAYGREVKDYLQTELGQESELHMFLKCFPELYEKLALKVSPFMDLNLIRKANAYFSNSKYTPVLKENYHDLATNKEFECKKCLSKSNSFDEFIQHQNETHYSSLKTTYDHYNGEESRSTPIGYLRSDPFAYILNLYWDNIIEKTCENCGETMLKGKFHKHAETCLPNVQIEEKIELIDRAEPLPMSIEEDKESTKLEIDESVPQDIEHKQEEMQLEEIITKQEEVKVVEEAVSGKRTRKRSSRLIDDLTVNNVLTTKRRVQNPKSNFAAENFVFFENGVKTRNSSGVANVEVNSEVSDITKRSNLTLVTRTVASSNETNENKPIKEEPTGEPVVTDNLNLSNIDDTISEVIQNTSQQQQMTLLQVPSLLESALKSDEGVKVEEVKIPKKRGRKSKSANLANVMPKEEKPIVETTHADTQPKIELRTSSRIKKVSQKKAEAEMDNLLVSQTLNFSRSSTDKKESTSLDVVTAMAALQEPSEEEPFQTMEIDDRKTEDTLSNVDNGKVTCKTCHLEFTSQNSANRHQERSCLRLSIEHIESEDGGVKRQCPCCGNLFPNTHSISIHIYKHHKHLLGPANSPPFEEAVKQNEQVKENQVNSTIIVKPQTQEQQQQQHAKVESIKIKKLSSSGENEEGTYVIQKKRKYTKRNVTHTALKSDDNTLDVEEDVACKRSKTNDVASSVRNEAEFSQDDRESYAVTHKTMIQHINESINIISLNNNNNDGEYIIHEDDSDDNNLPNSSDIAAKFFKSKTELK